MLFASRSFGQRFLSSQVKRKPEVTWILSPFWAPLQVHSKSVGQWVSIFQLVRRRKLIWWSLYIYNFWSLKARLLGSKSGIARCRHSYKCILRVRGRHAKVMIVLCLFCISFVYARHSVGWLVGWANGRPNTQFLCHFIFSFECKSSFSESQKIENLPGH